MSPALHAIDPNSDDDALIARLRQGDPAAFEQLFRAYYPSLVTYCDGFVHSIDVARELVQDVFFAMWVSRDALDVHGHPLRYLYGAVRNRALNALRHDRIVAQYAQRAGAEIPFATTLPEDAGTLDLAIAAALRELQPRAREAFTLFQERGLSHREIAEIMEISVRTVEAHVRRAVLHLRERLKDYR